jgi:hypothetical protein
MAPMMMKIGFKKRGIYWIFEKQYLSVSRPRTADRTHWGAREIMESIVCTAPAGD